MLYHQPSKKCMLCRQANTALKLSRLSGGKAARDICGFLSAATRCAKYIADWDSHHQQFSATFLWGAAEQPRLRQSMQPSLLQWLPGSTAVAAVCTHEMTRVQARLLQGLIIGDSQMKFLNKTRLYLRENSKVCTFSFGGTDAPQLMRKLCAM